MIHGSVNFRKLGTTPAQPVLRSRNQTSHWGSLPVGSPALKVTVLTIKSIHFFWPLFGHFKNEMIHFWLLGFNSTFVRFIPLLCAFVDCSVLLLHCIPFRELTTVRLLVLSLMDAGVSSPGCDRELWSF